ncbi:hypothetical protein VTK73DRAFT_1219 [Phialemonium thermophilum]|uniref:Uncharacterized protein n=1 Tax=Phialemonium thermophilum TaxID=223376 RepID=A0ABR3VTQ4_9PEZI
MLFEPAPGREYPSGCEMEDLERGDPSSGVPAREHQGVVDKEKGKQPASRDDTEAAGSAPTAAHQSAPEKPKPRIRFVEPINRPSREDDEEPARPYQHIHPRPPLPDIYSVLYGDKPGESSSSASKSRIASPATSTYLPELPATESRAKASSVTPSGGTPTGPETAVFGQSAKQAGSLNPFPRASWAADSDASKTPSRYRQVSPPKKFGFRDAGSLGEHEYAGSPAPRGFSGEFGRPGVYSSSYGYASPGGPAAGSWPARDHPRNPYAPQWAGSLPHLQTPGMGYRGASPAGNSLWLPNATWGHRVSAYATRPPMHQRSVSDPALDYALPNQPTARQRPAVSPPTPANAAQTTKPAREQDPTRLWSFASGVEDRLDVSPVHRTQREQRPLSEGAGESESLSRQPSWVTGLQKILHDPSDRPDTTLDFHQTAARLQRHFSRLAGEASRSHSPSGRRQSRSADAGDSAVDARDMSDDDGARKARTLRRPRSLTTEPGETYGMRVVGVPNARRHSPHHRQISAEQAPSGILKA